MVKMSPATKQRVSTVFSIVRFSFQWGFIPTLLFLGFRKGSDEGMPPLSFLSRVTMQSAMANRKIQELFGLMQKNLECSICLEMLTNPVSTKCGHQFCNFCMKEFLNTKRQVPCPLCKQPITKRSLTERPHLDEIVKNVRRLITAFQSDTGEIFSPPCGPQQLNFFSCTPESIKHKPSSSGKDQMKRTDKVKQGARNVRHSKRLSAAAENQNEDPMTGTYGNSPCNSSSFRNQTNTIEDNPVPANPENMDVNETKNYRSRFRTRNSAKTVSKVKSRGHSQNEAAEIQAELIHCIETGAHVKTVKNRRKNVLDENSVDEPIQNIGPFCSHEDELHGDITDEVDRCSRHVFIEMNDSPSVERFANMADKTEKDSAGVSDAESKSSGHVSLFRTPLPVDKKVKQTSAIKETVRPRTRSGSREKLAHRTENETDVVLTLTPDSVSSTIHSFCNGNLDSGSRNEKTYSKRQKVLGDKSADMERKVSDWFKTFPDNDENKPEEKEKPVENDEIENHRNKNLRSRSKKQNEHEFGNKMKALANQLIKTAASNLLFGFGEISDSQPSDTSKPDKNSTVVEATRSEEMIENVFGSNTEKEIEENCQNFAETDGAEESVDDLDTVKSNYVTKSFSQSVKDTDKFFEKKLPVKLLSENKDIRQNPEDDMQENKQDVIRQRRRIFRPKTNNVPNAVTDYRESEFKQKDENVKISKKLDDLDIVAVQKKCDMISDDSIDISVPQRLILETNLHEKLAAFGNNSPGSDPYEFKSSQRTPVKVMGKRKRGRKVIKKSKVMKNPLDLYSDIKMDEAAKHKNLSSDITRENRQSDGLSEGNQCSETSPTLGTSILRNKRTKPLISVLGGNPAEIKEIEMKISEAEDHTLLTCSQDAAESMEVEMQNRNQIPETSLSKVEKDTGISEKRVRFKEPDITDFVSPGKINIVAYRRAKEEFSRLKDGEKLPDEKQEQLKCRVKNADVSDKKYEFEDVQKEVTVGKLESVSKILEETKEIVPSDLKQAIDKTTVRDPMWTPSVNKEKTEDQQVESDHDSSGTDDLDIDPDLDQYEPVNLDLQPDSVKEKLSQDGFVKPLLMTPKHAGSLKDKFLRSYSNDLVTVVEETPAIYQPPSVVLETPVIFSNTEESLSHQQTQMASSSESLTQSPSVGVENTPGLMWKEKACEKGDAVPTVPSVNVGTECGPQQSSSSTQDSVSLFAPKTTSDISDIKMTLQRDEKNVKDQPPLTVNFANTMDELSVDSSGSVLVCSSSPVDNPVRRKKKRKSFMLEDPPDATDSVDNHPTSDSSITVLDVEESVPKLKAKRMRIGTKKESPLKGEPEKQQKRSPAQTTDEVTCLKETRKDSLPAQKLMNRCESNDINDACSPSKLTKSKEKLSEGQLYFNTDGEAKLKERQLSGILISPEESLKENDHIKQSPEDIFLMDLEMPSISYSPDGDTLRTVYLSDEEMMVAGELTLNEDHANREITYKKCSSSSEGKKVSDKSSEKSKNRNLSKRQAESDSESDLSQDWPRKRSGVKTARGFSNRKKSGGASAHSTNGNRIRSQQLTSLAPNNELEKNKTGLRNSPGRNGGKLYASVSKRDTGDVLQSPRQLSQRRKNPADCKMTFDVNSMPVLHLISPKKISPVENEDAVNTLTLPDLQASPREECMVSEIQCSSKEESEKYSQDKSRPDQNLGSQNSHISLCENDAKMDDSQGQEGQSVSLLTDLEVDTNLLRREYSNKSDQVKDVVLSLSLSMVPDSVPISGVGELSEEQDDDEEREEEVSDVQGNAESQSEVQRLKFDEEGKCLKGEETMGSSLDLDPADIEDDIDKHDEDIDDLDHNSLKLPELNLDEDTDIGIHGNMVASCLDDDLDCVEANMVDEKKEMVVTSSPVDGSSVAEVVEIQESDIEDDSDDLDLEDEPVRHKRPPRKAVILDSSDEGDSSQDSRHLNLTSSSAFSSQSETLGTQERLALEKDLERMSREMAEIRAQLKRAKAMNTSKIATPHLIRFRSNSTEDETVDERGKKSVGRRGDTRTENEVKKSLRKQEVYAVDDTDDSCDDTEDEIVEENSSEDSDDLFLSPPPLSPPFSLPIGQELANQNLPQDILEVTSLLDKVKGQMTDEKPDRSSQSSNMEPTRPVLREVISNSTAAPRERSVIVRGLLGTGLTMIQVNELKKLAAVNDCKVFTKFNASVSHVIVKPVPEDDGLCDRTLKFFQGVAGKCWVVSYHWVSDSRQAGHLLPEGPYEIKGDTTTGENHFGPRRSRLSKSNLFENFEFACIGTSANLTADDMQGLLDTCGGIIRKPSQMTGTGRIPVVITCKDYEEDEDGSQLTKEEQTQFKQLYQQYGIVTVSREWVLDSITTYTRLPLQDYILTSVKNVKIPTFD